MKIKLRDLGEAIQIRFTSTYKGTTSTWDDAVSRQSARVISEALNNILNGKVESVVLDLPELGE